MRRICASIILGALVWSCLSSHGQAAQVTVFGAASLSEALQELGAAYQKQSPDSIRFNLAGSSTLARQIESGAPADLFFSADERQMDALQSQGLLVQESRTSRLSNSLVIVVAAAHGARIEKPQDLAGERVGRLALAEPKSVPAGVYAKEYLQKLNLWSKVEAKVIPTDNVRAALAAVESGNVEAAIVYKTDAATSKKVKVVFEVPQGQGPRISYPVALLRDGPQPEAARRFLAYLKSPAADAVFARHGFGLSVPAGPGAKKP